MHCVRSFSAMRAAWRPPPHEEGRYVEGGLEAASPRKRYVEGGLEAASPRKRCYGFTVTLTKPAPVVMTPGAATRSRDEPTVRGRKETLVDVLAFAAIGMLSVPTVVLPLTRPATAGLALVMVKVNGGIPAGRVRTFCAPRLLPSELATPT